MLSHLTGCTHEYQTRCWRTHFCIDRFGAYSCCLSFRAPVLEVTFPADKPPARPCRVQCVAHNLQGFLLAIAVRLHPRARVHARRNAVSITASVFHDAGGWPKPGKESFVAQDSVELWGKLCLRITQLRCHQNFHAVCATAAATIVFVQITAGQYDPVAGFQKTVSF